MLKVSLEIQSGNVKGSVKNVIIVFNKLNTSTRTLVNDVTNRMSGLTKQGENLLTKLKQSEIIDLKDISINTKDNIINRYSFTMDANKINTLSEACNTALNFSKSLNRRNVLLNGLNDLKGNKTDIKFNKEEKNFYDYFIKYINKKKIIINTVALLSYCIILLTTYTLLTSINSLITCFIFRRFTS